MIKTARQLKDLIRNLSKDKSADAQILMRNYMMERFLERISLSEYRDKFILKGDPNMEKLWQAYQKKFSYAADLSWHTVMESIRSLYELARE